jgi:hypothetical protein
MKILYMAHSGLRYLVLLLAVALVVYCIVGLATKGTAGRPLRSLNAAFVGLLDLQVLLGVGLVLSGIYYPALIGHMVMMIAAAALAHVMSVRNRKRPQPGFVLPLVGTGGALLLIIGGILSIGRGVMETVPYPY